MTAYGDAQHGQAGSDVAAARALGLLAGWDARFMLVVR
jgi:hypothetical protein